VFLVFVVVAVVAVVVDVVCFCFIVDFIYCSVCFNVHWPVFAGKKTHECSVFSTSPPTVG
jgi:hypothetical protein